MRKSDRRWVRAIVALVAVVVLILPLPARAFDPTEAYEKRTVQGFTVYVNPLVLKQRQPAADALRELDGQLTRIRGVVPKRALAAMLKMPIWLEWEAKPNGAAEFHPSAGWLTANGYNPAKAGGVELSNARNFVKWSRDVQQWMLLHEMSHGYHFLVLGEADKRVKEAYRNAMDKHLYDSVEYARREKKQAYAATNEKEYFAEMSEAYFGRNDFYPYNRADLQKHDPVAFKLMYDAWGMAVAEGEPWVEKAEAAVKAGNAAGALTYLAKLTPDARADKELAGRLAALSPALAPAAEAALGEVEAMVAAGRRGAAVARLKDLAAATAGTPAGEKAQRRLDELAGKPTG